MLLMSNNNFVFRKRNIIQINFYFQLFGINTVVIIFLSLRKVKSGRAITFPQIWWKNKNSGTYKIEMFEYSV